MNMLDALPPDQQQFVLAIIDTPDGHVDGARGHVCKQCKGLKAGPSGSKEGCTCCSCAGCAACTKKGMKTYLKPHRCGEDRIGRQTEKHIIIKCKECNKRVREKRQQSNDLKHLTQFAAQLFSVARASSLPATSVQPQCDGSITEVAHFAPAPPTALASATAVAAAADTDTAAAASAILALASSVSSLPAGHSTALASAMWTQPDHVDGAASAPAPGDTSAAVSAAEAASAASAAAISAAAATASTTTTLASVPPAHSAPEPPSAAPNAESKRNRRSPARLMDEPSGPQLKRQAKTIALKVVHEGRESASDFVSSLDGHLLVLCNIVDSSAFSAEEWLGSRQVLREKATSSTSSTYIAFNACELTPGNKFHASKCLWYCGDNTWRSSYQYTACERSAMMVANTLDMKVVGSGALIFDLKGHEPDLRVGTRQGCHF
jgi:hypothetical protein